VVEANYVATERVEESIGHQVSPNVDEVLASGVSSSNLADTKCVYRLTMHLVRACFIRTRLLALILALPLSCSDLGGSAAKACAAHRSNNADDACYEGSEEPSAGETESAEADPEADPEVVVSP